MEEEIKQETKPEEMSLLEKSELIARRIEEANKRSEELLARQEKILSQQLLSGRSSAGKEPEKPKELTPLEYAEQVRNGKINPFDVK